MASNFEVLKEIGQRYKDIVSGYMKRCELEYSINSIPELVIISCLLFYYESLEFDKHGKHVKLSDDKKTFTKIGNHSGFDYCYGSIWMSPYTNTTIKLKINSIDYAHIFLGITSAELDWPNVTSIELVNKPNYCYLSNGRPYINGCPVPMEQKGKPLKKNDILTICLKKGNIQFSVNDEPQWNAKDIPKNVDYTLVIQPWCKNESVTIVQYSTT